MNFTEIKPANASLGKYGISKVKAYWNLRTSDLEKISIEKGMATRSASGAIAIDTGEFTGRSPKDRFIVEDELTKNAIWWGNTNIKFDTEKFNSLKGKLTDYLSGKEIYIRDVYACADDRYRLKIRVIHELPWSNLFTNNMFLHPSEEELKYFEPDWIILNSPNFKADLMVSGTRRHNFTILNFIKQMLIIGGTGYTGEIKKGIFSVLSFILPRQKNVLSMHCSANVGQNGDIALFFGLSGTGKTTLSADANRKLIGDDEHGWTEDNVIFNFEGGCYAKVIDLSEEKEPDIFHAIKKGALLENITFKEGSNEVDYQDSSKTENARVSYPLSYISNIEKPYKDNNPKNIFFLTCDAYGVLPPISKLTPGQTVFHFINGYTAKVAGTETGITDPITVFSACFGAPFMPLYPIKYADMLSHKIQEVKVDVWLVNTGWSGGPYKVGKRMKLKYTRAMITASLNGELNDVNYEKHKIFGLMMPETCPNVPNEILHPRNMWHDKKEYDKTANELAKKFINNFEKFADYAYANEEILGGRTQDNG